MSFSIIVPGDPKEVANKVSDSIFKHKDDISGRHTSSPNLDYSKIKEKEGAFIVKYWSEGGVFHDCWIEVTIERLDDKHCVVTIDGCKETMELAKIIANEIKV
ncbi:MAG: hypothetical protein ABDI20_02030 [Candidatus Bipolaricaulaceae bacterium]